MYFGVNVWFSCLFCWLWCFDFSVCLSGILNYIYMLGVGIHTMAYTWVTHMEGGKTLCRRLFSSSILWVRAIKLRLSGLVTGAFTY